MKTKISGADLLMKLLKEVVADREQVNPASVEIIASGEMTGDGDDIDNHKQSFLVGEQIVKKVVPQVYEGLPPAACRCCYSKGAMLAAISYATFLHHGKDELAPDEDLRELFHDMMNDAFDAGFEAHKQWLAEEANKHEVKQ